MSFRLQAAEPVPEEIRRIVSEQIADAVQELGDRRRNVHKAIHSARQRCKRVRAVVRLARTDLGDHYATENRRFRDIARKLSNARDAEAVIESTDKLYAECEGPREIDLLRAVRRTLSARHRQVTAGEEGLAARMMEVADELREAQAQIAAWPLPTQGFDLLGPGIQKTYANTREAFFKAYRDPVDANFHEARKHVKYHWYHMRLVHNIWPHMLRAYRRSLKTLSDHLGDDHDLAVMRTIMLERTGTFDARDLHDVMRLIERRQARLKTQAHVLGRRVFAERSANFRKRLGRYWQGWQEETNPPVVEPQDSDIVPRAVA